MKRNLMSSLVFGIAFWAMGCASIFQGNSQRIKVFSDPSGATVSAGDQRITTPGELLLPRKAESIEIRVELEGYTPKIVSLVRRVSGSTWWNLGWIVAGTSLGLAATQTSVLSDSTSKDAGNGILAGGVAIGALGFLTDFKSGAAYRLEPATLAVKLQREQPRPPPNP